MEDFLSREIPARTFEELEIPSESGGHKFLGPPPGGIRPAATSSPPSGPPWPCRQFSNRYILNDTVLIDGGAVNPLPYDLIRPECDLTIAIDVSGEKTYAPGNPVPNMVESILSTFQIMQASIVAAKKRTFPAGYLCQTGPDQYPGPGLLPL